MSGQASAATSLPWVIIGYGRVGQSLNLLADRLNADITATWNRTEAAVDNAAVASPNPRHGALPDALDDLFDAPRLIWLTVVDDAIVDVFDAVVDSIADGSIIVHTSGSLPSTILSERTDLDVASLHPLQAISDPRAALQRFPSSFWSIEGDDAAVEYLTELVEPAGIKPVRINPETKLLYHASAVTAANLLVSLLDGAIEMTGHAGIEPPQARQMLVNLAESSLKNLADQPPAEALTGPAARGDTKIIERHRQALAELDDPTLLKIYDLLTDRALAGLGED